MHNPRYPLELLQRIITVSLETMKIVNNLPKLEIHYAVRSESTETVSHGKEHR